MYTLDDDATVLCVLSDPIPSITATHCTVLVTVFIEISVAENPIVDGTETLDMPCVPYIDEVVLSVLIAEYTFPPDVSHERENTAPRDTLHTTKLFHRYELTSGISWPTMFAEKYVASYFGFSYTLKGVVY